jgi:hypothetical protein
MEIMITYIEVSTPHIKKYNVSRPTTVAWTQRAMGTRLNSLFFVSYRRERVKEEDGKVLW